MRGFEVYPVPIERPSPVMAIIMHQFGQDGFVTLHDVMETGEGVPIIGAGRIGDGTDVAGALNWMLTQTEMEVAYLPPKVVSLSNRHCVWLAKSRGREPLWFNCGGMTLKVDAPWPHLLYGANRNGKLYVAALGSSRRPAVSTRLYHAPLMNVDAFGRVCTGTADLPASCGIPDIPAWEQVMHDTCYSHVNQSHTLNLGKPSGGKPNRRGKPLREVTNALHIKFWRGLEKSGATVFPRGNLVAMGQSVDDFIQRVSHAS